jgi:CDP-diacylglycerol---serine O-phosphatidyltransferase
LDRHTVTVIGGVRRRIPIFVSLSVVACGMVAMYFAHQGEFGWAAFLICFGVLLDGLDGRIARWLNSTSKLGGALDSLCDQCAFGVAPAVVVYFWNLEKAGPVFLAVLLIYVCACAYHLAVFDEGFASDDKTSPAYRFIIGLPVPVAAGLVLLPIMLDLQFGDGSDGDVWVHTAVLALAAYLTASSLPFYSLKDFKYGNQVSVVSVLLAVLLIAGMIFQPWATFSLIVIAYMSTTPFSITSFRRMRDAAS